MKKPTCTFSRRFFHSYLKETFFVSLRYVCARRFFYSYLKETKNINNQFLNEMLFNMKIAIPVVKFTLP